MPNGPPGPQPGPPPAAVPGWLAPIVSITTQVGVPTVIAGVLLWFLLTRVDSMLRHIAEEEDARTKTVAAMQDTLIAALDKLGERFERAIDANIQANRALADRHAPRDQ